MFVGGKYEMAGEGLLYYLIKRKRSSPRRLLIVVVGGGGRGGVKGGFISSLEVLVLPE